MPAVWRGPTFWTTVATATGVIALFVACHVGAISWRTNWLLASPLYYLLIICGHDAVHHSAHTSRRVNDAMGWCTLLFFCIPFSVVARAHRTHHARLGHREQIEEFGTRPGVTLPLRWVFGNYCYYGILPECTRWERFLAIANLTIVCAMLCAWPYPVLVEWMLPMQTGVAYIMFTTIYMPHGPYRELVDAHVAWVTGFHNAHHALPAYPFHQIALASVRRHAGD